MTEKEKVLVIGASGRVGGELLKLLQENSITARAAMRNPAMTGVPAGSVEAAPFDFENSQTFAPALKGISRVFLIARPGDNHSDEIAAPFIDEAVKAGVGLIVNLTAMGAEQDLSFMLRKLELYLEQSGIQYVHLRPNWFMQNFSSPPMLTEMVRTGALHLTASDASLSFIDVRDIASVAFAALTDDAHAGKAYTLTGGEALSHFQVVEEISRAAGKAIGYVPLTEEIACAGLRKAGVAEGLIDRWTDFYRKVRQGLCAPVSPDVSRILQREPISFRQYAADYAAAWQ